MLLAVFAEKTRQYILSDGRGSSKGELSGMIPAQQGNLLFRLDEERIRLLRVTQQNLACLGQCYLRSSAIEELDANIFLKRLDLEAHRGLRQIQLFSGLAKAVLLGYGSENDQAKIVETRHKVIRTLLAWSAGGDLAAIPRLSSHFRRSFSQKALPSRLSSAGSYAHCLPQSLIVRLTHPAVLQQAEIPAVSTRQSRRAEGARVRCPACANSWRYWPQ